MFTPGFKSVGSGVRRSRPHLHKKNCFFKMLDVLSEGLGASLRAFEM
jgi:hypothetical protein